MNRAVLAVAVGVILTVMTGCSTLSPQIALTPQPTLSPPSAVTAVPTAQTPLRTVHTPAVVVVDEQLSAGECHARTVDAARGDYLPDAACTPGAIDPAVSQADIQQTICVRGYTATVRPPAAATGRFKSISYAAYSEQYSTTTELDHLVPLELGGASSASNLWVEPNRTLASSFNNPKDKVENSLHAAVCNGTVTLAAAQNAIAADWTTALAALHLGAG